MSPPGQPGAAGSDPPADVTQETTEEPPPEPPPLEGLEALALTIDTGKEGGGLGEEVMIFGGMETPPHTMRSPPQIK